MNWLLLSLCNCVHPTTAFDLTLAHCCIVKRVVTDIQPPEMLAVCYNFKQTAPCHHSMVPALPQITLHLQ